MLPTDQLAAISIAMALGYFSLRTFGNADRYLRKLYPWVLTVGAIARYLHLQHVAVPVTSSGLNVSGSSHLLQLYAYLQREHPALEVVAGDLLLVIALVSVFTTALDAVRKLRYVNRKTVLNNGGAALISVAEKLPIVSGMLRAKMQEFETQVEEAMHEDPFIASKEKHYALPAKGMADEAVISTLEDLVGDADERWKNGMVSGAVYHGQQDHLEVLNKAYSLFAVSNPLHASLFPAVRKFEAEVVAMTAALLNGGDENVCGALSSGGTESIFLAAKTHREWFRKMHNITQPEIIACVTAHAAIDKACELMNIKLIKVPCNPDTMKIDCDAVRWNITANTIMIYGSAPNYPNGAIDDIEELSQIALANGVGLHVDCCLGGFIVPFARKLFPDITPKFDFELPGVTSMSCDTHKYGYGGKGTSVVLYRSKEIRHYQYFTYPDWTGGLYMTPSLAGSRPGALIATAWASMMRLGYEGYLKTAESILKTAQEIKAGIHKIEGIRVLGDPVAMVVSFVGEQGVDVLAVGDAMGKKGWELNLLLHPCAVHICVTVLHVGKATKFLDDLAACVKTVKENPSLKAGSSTAIYGMSESVPAGPVNDILRVYADVSLKV